MEPVLGEKSRERIQLGLHESLVNAVVHGNLMGFGQDIQKHLHGL